MVEDGEVSSTQFQSDRRFVDYVYYLVLLIVADHFVANTRLRSGSRWPCLGRQPPCRSKAKATYAGVAAYRYREDPGVGKADP